MVPEYYQTTRTTYRTECVEEAYTVNKTEYSQETRTCQVPVTRHVTVCEDRTVTKCVMVPCVETRTVMKRVETCTPVTTTCRKLVRAGHWECVEVACGPTLGERLGKFKKHGCGCDPCAPVCCEPCPRTKTVKRWVACPEYCEVPVTKMVKSYTCVPETCQVTVCKPTTVTEVVKVNVCKCVTEYCTKTYTVCVPRCVAVQCTRKVSKCVPVCENVTACRMVCRKVAKEVACEAAPTCCEAAPCCHKRFNFSGLFAKKCKGGCDTGCSSGCGCN